MKRIVLFGALAWLLLITLAHIQLNVGWSRLGHSVLVRLGKEKKELLVGFLPVT